MLVAGVDIGTLTCRLLIAEITQDGKLLERRSDRRILRLGEGVDRTQMLTPSAMDRVCQTLRNWRAIIDDARVDGETAVATSAVREAANRDLFLQRANQEAGFEIEVITGEEEARRTLLGVRFGAPDHVSAMLGIDIGGGSTELFLDRPPQSPVIRSIDVGVVRMAERFLHHDPPTDIEVRLARKAITTALRSVQRSLGSLRDATLIGTAGSVTTLAAMAQRLPAYESSRIHNYRLRLDTIRQLETEILGRSKEQRRGMFGLEDGREEVIAAGVLILGETLETLGYPDCLVSDYGLREGVLIDLAQRMK